MCRSQDKSGEDVLKPFTDKTKSLTSAAGRSSFRMELVDRKLAHYGPENLLTTTDKRTYCLDVRPSHIARFHFRFGKVSAERVLMLI